MNHGLLLVKSAALAPPSPSSPPSTHLYHPNIFTSLLFFVDLPSGGFGFHIVHSCHHGCHVQMPCLTTSCSYFLGTEAMFANLGQCTALSTRVQDSILAAKVQRCYS
ncbi:hypothetical protein MKW98_003215 [Papaver atlanticum]|uniref:Uncharacterized protein n=1 Tax=Papaver atlanticum TaxID=357466 RepID=A0AAD4XI02_9MAGN|nr:hypothetical protein MKW98_003215 [Papaver atlanticum]